MPLYEYQCDNCGEKFEVRRPIRASDDPAACPNCESNDSRRQVSLFMTFVKGAEGTQSMGGGCGCGGACSCGGSHLN
jgi:putative FmdB family regulatory protein